MICPTVAVLSDSAPNGFMIINESDFNENVHQRFEVAPAPALPPLPPLPVAPVDPLADLPANWPELRLGKLQPIVQTIFGRTADNREQAVQMLNEALAARGAQ